MAAGKVLVVEDDRTLLGVLKYNLAKDGFSVVTANDGEAAIDEARKERPELIVLDIMLPKLDGFEVCRILRREMTVPILMLTARVDEIDKVVGLELGADDYLTKPFSMRELLARIRAMLRRNEMIRQEMLRSSDTEVPIVKIGDFEIDYVRHQVTLDGSLVSLSPKEFDLLAFLVKNRGRVFSRERLLESVWGYDYVGDTRTVDVHISWLRRKIEPSPMRPKHLLTVRGVGYKFED
ncbi:MAG: response regulator transcription factor [Chloroflexota bacterium]